MSGAVFSGPAATTLFRWISVRMQLKLEAKGLRSSGGAIRPRIAQSLGLKPTASYADFDAAIMRKVEELQQAMPAGAIQVLK